MPTVSWGWAEAGWPVVSLVSGCPAVTRGKRRQSFQVPSPGGLARVHSCGVSRFQKMGGVSEAGAGGILSSAVSRPAQGREWGNKLPLLMRGAAESPRGVDTGGRSTMAALTGGRRTAVHVPLVPAAGKGESAGVPGGREPRQPSAPLQGSSAHGRVGGGHRPRSPQDPIPPQMT